MLICLFVLLFTATVALRNESCDYVVHVKGSEVKELRNPRYPLRDLPFQNCTWSVVADVDRRLILVCPIDESDTRGDPRILCGAEMSVWDSAGDPTLYCRDKSFARIGTNNRMYINYKNDHGDYYYRTAGFKCYVYAKMAFLSLPFDLSAKKEYEATSFQKCDFLITLSKYDFVRLATTKYTQAREKWRRCRWTAVSPEDSKISVTCPFTERPPYPVLMQVEPCTSEFTITLFNDVKTYHCNDKSFSETSEKNRIVFEELSIRRLPSRDFECYIYSELPEIKIATGPSPYENCDHIIELNSTAINIQTPNFPGALEPKTNCRWTVVAPENNRIVMSCSSTDSVPNEELQCLGKLDLTMLGGEVVHPCQNDSVVDTIDDYTYRFPYNGMTITYSNEVTLALEPFECTLFAKPEDECQNCTDPKPYKIIKLKKREATQLLSPNYPEKEPAGSTARWTVVSDMDRRIVLVCPFYHSIKETYTPEDAQPCNGQFIISPDHGEDSSHCQDRGFSRISVNHIMIITYKNQLTEPLDAFTCYVYAELKERWDSLEYHPASEKLDFDYHITLDGINMTTLVPPTNPEYDEKKDEKKLWKSRWNISALYEGVITIACHFTDKPPAPLTIQVLPCFGQFTVMYGETKLTHHCEKGAFSHTTDSGWMVLVYENLQKRPVDNFVCIAYSINKTISYEVKQKVYKNPACDYLISIDRNKMITVDSIEYEVKKNSSRSTCRWFFLAKEGSRIVLACPLHDPKAAPKASCHGQFSVLSDYMTESMFCGDQAFSRTSLTNKLVLIYENEFSQTMEPFTCEVYAIGSELENFISMETFVKKDCDHGVIVPDGDATELPYYPFSVPGIECRWTAAAEQNRRIVFTCVSSKIDDPLKEDTDVCYGRFTVAPEGAHETSHCGDRTFSRVGETNRMIITYNTTNRNYSDPDVSAYKCYLYTQANDEIKIASDDGHGPINTKCDYVINLEALDEIRLINQLQVEEEQRWSSCRWKVVAPSGLPVKLTCPYTDKPPDPVTIQVYPCSGKFSITIQKETEIHKCTEKAFSVNSTTNEMIIFYENPSDKRPEDYQCYVYFEPRLEDNVLGTSPYAGCDEFIEVGFKEVQFLNSPNYPKKSKPRTSCRWHVLSPPNSRLVLNCNFAKLEFVDEEELEYCNAGFVIKTAPDDDKKWECGIYGFYEYSPKNNMIITYETPTRQHVEVFQCHIHAEKKKDNCKNCTGIDAFDFDDCHHNITISDSGILKRLLISPSPWTPCLWNVTFPSNKNVDISCIRHDHEEVHSDCKGYFTVYKTGKFEDGELHCSDKPFSVAKDGNQDGSLTNFLITYSGEERQDPLNCTLEAFDKACDVTMNLNLKSIKESVDIQIPYFPTVVLPWYSCTWNIIAPEKPVRYQAIVQCYKTRPAEKDDLDTCDHPLTVALDGDLEHGYESCSDNQDVHTSLTNNITLNWILPEGAYPLQLIGCRAYMIRRPPPEEQGSCNCGWSLIHTKTKYRRIAHGKTVQPSEFPMMAGLVNLKANNTLFCGGTIISRRYILTAAACVLEAEKKEYKVGAIVDSYDRTTENEFLLSLYTADGLIAHENYTAKPHLNDIGLIHMREDIRFDDNVGQACLPFYDKTNWKYFETRQVFAVGWGEPIDSKSVYLKKIEGTVATDNDCEYYQKELSSAQHICITHERESVCKIDRGGPVLFFDEEVRRIKLIGILFAKKTCAGYYHTKATEIIPFLDWIVENTPGVFYCKSL